MATVEDIVKIIIATQGVPQSEADLRRLSSTINSVGASARNASQVSGAAFGQMGQSANLISATFGKTISSTAQVFQNAARFSTQFLGFIVVNKALQTFSDLTLGSGKAAADFQTGLVAVGKTTDLTGEQLQRLGDNFRQVSRELPITTTELLKVGEIAGQIGITGVKNLTDFSVTIEKLSKTTNLSAEQGALALARFQNIVGIPTSQITNVSSAIVDLGNKFASSETEITEFSLRLAGAGRVLGLSAANILGFGNALASVGVQAEAGGTAFSRVFININSAAAAGGTALASFAKVAGVTTDSFRALVRSDPAQAVIAFLQGLANLKNSGQDIIPILNSVGFNNIRVRDSLLRATEGIDVFKSSIETSNMAFEQNSALQIEFQKKTATTASAAQVLANNFKDLQISLGNIFLGGAAKASQSLTNFVQSLSGTKTGASDTGDSLRQVFIILKEIMGGLAQAIKPLSDMAGSFNAIGISAGIAVKALAALAAFQILEGLAHLATRIGAVSTATKSLTASIIASNMAQAGMVNYANMGRTSPGELGFALQRTGTLNPVLGPRGNLMGLTPTSFMLPTVETIAPSITAAEIAAFRNANRGAGGRFPAGLTNDSIRRSIAQQRLPGMTSQALMAGYATGDFMTLSSAANMGVVQTIRTLGLRAGGLAVVEQSLKNIVGFLKTPTGAILGITVALTAIDMALQHFTGQGLAQTFSLADEKADGFSKRLAEVNAQMDDLNRTVAKGNLTQKEAGLQGLTSLVGNTSQGFDRLAQIQKQLNDNNIKYGVANKIGVAGGAAVGTVIGAAIGTPFGGPIGAAGGAVIGGLVGGAGGKLIAEAITGQKGLEEQAARLKGQISENGKAIVEFARNYSLTLHDLEQKGIEIQSITISDKAKEQLTKDFNDAAKIIAAEQFSAQIGRSSFAAFQTEGTFKQIESDQKKAMDDAKAKQIPSWVRPAPDTKKVFGFGQADLSQYTQQISDYRDKIALAWKDQTIFADEVEATKKAFADSPYKPTALQVEIFGQELNKVVDAQDRNRKALLVGHPQLFAEMAKDATQFGQVSSNTLKLVSKSVQDLAANGKPISQLFDVNELKNVPKDVLNSAVALGTLSANAELSDKEITNTVAAIKRLNVGDDVKDFLITLFTYPNKAALEFQDTLDGLKQDIKNLPSMADALNLSPDILTKGGKAAFNQFISDATQALTGVSSQGTGIFLDASGTQKQIELADQYGKALDSAITNNLITVRSFGIEGKEVFTTFQKNWTDLVDALATSKLSVVDRADIAQQFLSITNTLSELEASGKLTPEVKFALDEASRQLVLQAKNNLGASITIDVRLSLKLEEFYNQLKNLGKSSTIGQIISNMLGINKLLATPASAGAQPSNLTPEQQKAAGLFPQVQNIPGLDVGLNEAAASASKELTQFQKDLIEISKTLIKLNITAEEFIKLNKLTGLGAEMGRLDELFTKLGVNVADFNNILDKVSFEKFLKAIGATDQAIAQGTAQKKLEELLPGISKDKELQDIFAKFLQALDRTKAGQTIPGFSIIEDLLSGKMTPEQLKAINPAVPSAYGDIFTKPTFAMIGEAGPEIVLPLSKPDRMKALLGKAGIPMLADGAIVGNIMGVEKAKMDSFNSYAARPSSNDVYRSETNATTINAPITIRGDGDSAFNIAQRTQNKLSRFYELTNKRRRPAF